MKWKKYTIRTTTQAEDFVSGMLMELGVEGVEIEDKRQISEEEKRQMYIDLLPELSEDDGVAYVSFYTELAGSGAHSVSGQGTADNAAQKTAGGLMREADAPQLPAELPAEQLLERIREALSEMSSYVDVGEASITEDETEDKDWINNWKEYFQPFTVDGVLIKPSWHQMSREEKQAYPLTIEIDPGTSFGTGLHETTQLVLRALRKYVTPETKLLDVGCGSGILSILALKLGAAHAVCMDIDPAAVQATAENMEANGIAPERYDVFCGNLLAGGEEAKASRTQAGCGYDIAAANILADVIIPMTDVIGAHLKPGGLFITSGILDTKEASVKEAMEKNGFEIIETAKQNDWVSVIARKP